MANKTQPTKQKVSEFIASVDDPRQRADCRELMKLMSRVTGKRAKMWGPSIVGYGKYHYRYASGREGDFFLTGFSPRKQTLTIYIISGFELNPELMGKLGKFKTLIMVIGELLKEGLSTNFLDIVNLPF